MLTQAGAPVPHNLRRCLCWGGVLAAAVAGGVAWLGPATFTQQLLNGLHLGSICALIALGYTMVYGILKLINFAHGDLFMFGAYVACFTGTAALARGQVAWVALPAVLIAAMAATGLLGWCIERFAYRPLRAQPRLSALITALGVSLLLENFFALPPQDVPWPVSAVVFGPDPVAFPKLIEDVPLTVAGVSFSSVKLACLLVAVALMLGLEWFVHRTRTGLAMRAVAQQRDGAALMGINVDRIIALTFVIGSALGAAGGLLFGLSYGSLNSPTLGITPGLKAFIAAVLGGIGSIPGAMLGGYLMGVSETFATALNSNLGSGIAFVILILVLLWKPTGLLGSTRREKV